MICCQAGVRPAERIIAGPRGLPSVRRRKVRADCRSCWRRGNSSPARESAPRVTPTCESRRGTPTRSQSFSISCRNAVGRVGRRLRDCGRTAGGSAGRNRPGTTSMLTRMAAGSISAQAAPCGTRQCVPRAAATPWAIPSPELASAMPDSSAACDMASRAGRERPFSTASTIAGTAILQPLHRQGAGNRLRLPRHVALDQLGDRVHAAGRRDRRRNRHRQLGIDQGDPRHQPIVAEALLERRIVATRSRRSSWPRRPVPAVVGMASTGSGGRTIFSPRPTFSR